MRKDLTFEEFADILLNTPATYQGLAEVLIRCEETDYRKWYDMFYEHAWCRGLRCDREHINDRIAHYKKIAEKKLNKTVTFEKEGYDIEHKGYM